MSAPQLYRVFKLKHNLAMQDPDMPSPRYHTVVFVETNASGPGSGTKHHVTGDIVTGMSYVSELYDDPQKSDDLYSQELIGYTDASSHPHGWDGVLSRVPAPPKQKAFNIKAMKTEPVKAWNPLAFYEPGEPRRPLVKCTEWVEQQAIPILVSKGLLQTGTAAS